MNRRWMVFLLAVVALLAFAALSWNAVPVAAGPALQVTITPRPKLTPEPGEPPKPEVQSALPPPRLHGTILDWGKGNMPAGVKVVLSGDGWQIPVETDASGEYVFQDIGNEVGFLHAFVPDDRGDLAVLASDLPVRIDVNKELIVNLALYPRDTIPDPLIGLEVVPSFSEAERDENVSYAVTVANHWEGGINQVIVADFLPEGLTYLTASASQGSVVFDRGLVWADLGPMAAGASATVTIIAKVNGGVDAGTILVNRVSAYHSDNAAVQGEASVTVVEHTNGVLPVTGWASALPFAGLFLAGLVFFALRLRRSGS
jgi:uncharacterized repeat protein (TIGR01451 family)